MDSLDWQELMGDAERTTALSMWGDRGFVDGLKTLTTAIAANRRLPDQAREGARAQVAALRAKRLRLYDDRESHPEIPAQQIRAPLIVIGMPRSGTTLLHALLAQDWRARAPLTWEVEQPSPPPRGEKFASDPRIAASQAQIDHVPDAFKRMHSSACTWSAPNCRWSATASSRSPSRAVISARCSTYPRIWTGT